MKKLMSCLLSVVMLLSLLPNAFASNDSELTNVVKIAKSRLSIPAEYTEFESSKNTLADMNVYNLTWRNTEASPSEIDVTVLPSGEIVSYHYYDAERDYGKTGVAAFEKAEYLERAKTWISRVNPSYVAELDFEGEVWIGSVQSPYVSVEFGRKINGIPVYDNYVHISLDKYSGEIISMSSGWVHAKKTAEPEDIISNEEAGKILGEMAELELRYERLRDENHAVLMYSPSSHNLMINAFDGATFTIEYVDSEEDYGASSEYTNDSADMKAEGSLSREEMENIDEVESLLSKNVLAETIKKMAGTAVASYTVKSVSYRNVGTNELKVYEARVYLTNSDGESANVTFDAKTGELKSFYTYVKYDSDKKQTKSSEELKVTAEKFINVWAADVADKAKIFDDRAYGGYFVFTHEENGIEYDGNRISVSVDERTGKILSFSKNWDKDITFDSADGVISKEEAVSKFVDTAKVELWYVGNGRELYAQNKAEELVLIYRLGDDAPAYIDAKTGDAYDWSMGQSGDEPEEYVLQKDLSGHWAENAVKTLADNGIVLSYEDSFCPNEEISQKEIALLVECFEGGYFPYMADEETYKSVVDSLVRRSIIEPEEKNPEAKVTREECVAYLVRMFGFGDAAEIKGIYKTGFSDEVQISADKLGYVAIAKGIGLVSGNDGTFCPKKNVTRAELAMMLYNALDR